MTLHDPVPFWFRGKDMTSKLDAIETGGRLVLNEPLSAAWMDRKQEVVRCMLPTTKNLWGQLEMIVDG